MSDYPVGEDSKPMNPSTLVGGVPIKSNTIKAPLLPMFSSVDSQPNLTEPGPAPTKIIQSQTQYRTCQIRVPDLQQPVPAIRVDNEFYSFFKAVEEAEKAFEIVAKLGNGGDSTVITKTPKGYAIWVKEPLAEVHRSSKAKN